MLSTMRWLYPLLFAIALAACSSQDPEADVEALPEEGEPVTPPFEVQGDAEGLLLVWFDEEGLHTASSRGEIPEARRAMVRVEDLTIEDSLDPELVYVADLREPGDDGQYEVRRLARARFEDAVAEASGATEPIAAAEPSADGEPADADVVIYGASWCSACHSAAAFLRQRGIDFVERDIEREPGARQAMLRAARRAGINPSGIPVIDFRGQVIAGFDRAALERAIEQTRQPI